MAAPVTWPAALDVVLPTRRWTLVARAQWIVPHVPVPPPQAKRMGYGEAFRWASNYIK